MKRVLILTILMLTALLVLFVSCGDDSKAESPFTTVKDTAPPLPDVDHNLAVSSVFDYSFCYGSFVKSSYNGAGNPTSRVYYDPTSMTAIPLSFYYQYGSDGILSSLTLGEGAYAIALSLEYNSQGIPAKASANLDGSVYSIYFTCDSRGRILGEKYPFVTHTYNENGRLVKESGVDYSINFTQTDATSIVSATHLGEEAFDLSITYDEKDYPISMTGVVNGAEPWQYTDGLATWEYNDKALCTKVSVKGGKEHTELVYAYDEGGALVTTTRTDYNQQGKVTNTETYDAKGNLIR